MKVVANSCCDRKNLSLFQRMLNPREGNKDRVNSSEGRMWLEEPNLPTKSSCLPKLLASVRENVLGTLTTYDILV